MNSITRRVVIEETPVHNFCMHPESCPYCRPILIEGYEEEMRRREAEKEAETEGEDHA